MSNHTIPFILFGLSLVMLLVRLYTKEKRDFIISVAFIVSGSGYIYFTIPGSILIYFFGAVILSFIGDLLMAKWIRITQQRTIDGATAFGFAHILYIIGFNQLNYGWFNLLDDWWYIPVWLVLTVVLFQLIGNNPDLHWVHRVSNAIYAILIITLLMFVLAFTLSSNVALLVRLVAIAGMLSFLISDGILAYNEFQKPIPHAKDIIAVTYVVAQILLQSVPLLIFLS